MRIGFPSVRPRLWPGILTSILTGSRGSRRPRSPGGAGKGADRRLRDKSGEIGERAAEERRENDPQGHVAGEIEGPAVQFPHDEREGQGGEDQRQIGEPRPGAPEIVDIERGEHGRISGREREPRPGPEARPRQSAFHATTRCACRPSPSTPSDIVSPALRKRCGFLPEPTPGGVPVVMTSPGSRIMNCEMYETSVLTPKIMVAVEPVCMRSPLTSRNMLSFCTSAISSGVTSQGPRGPKVGALLPFTHCPDRSNWNSRSETSLQMQ